MQRRPAISVAGTGARPMGPPLPPLPLGWVAPRMSMTGHALRWEPKTTSARKGLPVPGRYAVQQRTARIAIDVVLLDIQPTVFHAYRGPHAVMPSPTMTWTIAHGRPRAPFSRQAGRHSSSPRAALPPTRMSTAYSAQGKAAGRATSRCRQCRIRTRKIESGFKRLSVDLRGQAQLIPLP